MNGKSCLLAFLNKKINYYGNISDIVKRFADYGYHFEKVSCVAYDDAEGISRSLKDGTENYDNTVIYCPVSMEKPVKEYVSFVCGGEFDTLGQLKKENTSVFLIFSDGENRLRIEDIKSVLDEKYSRRYDRTFIKTVGAPSDETARAVSEAKLVCPEADFNVSEKYGDCVIEIVYSDATPKMSIDEAVRGIVKALNPYVYALDDTALPERLVQLLKLRRMKIRTAESFTGGGVGKKIVSVSGASEVYEEGLNTYSNEAKVFRLGVDEMTLKHYGAVSENVAREMAAGLLSQDGCDVAISTTGIAGPKSDNTNKPVGLAYIAVGTRGDIQVYKFNFVGNRTEITERAINTALFLAFKALK